eukprot:11005756-Heterocapsa_arctica.AAC.1
MEPANIPVIDDEQWVFFLEPDIEGALPGGEAAEYQRLPGGEAAEEEEQQLPGGEAAEEEEESLEEDEEVDRLLAEEERGDRR